MKESNKERLYIYCVVTLGVLVTVFLSSCIIFLIKAIWQAILA